MSAVFEFIEFVFINFGNYINVMEHFLQKNIEKVFLLCALWNFFKRL